MGNAPAVDASKRGAGAARRSPRADQSEAVADGEALAFRFAAASLSVSRSNRSRRTRRKRTLITVFRRKYPESAAE